MAGKKKKRRKLAEELERGMESASSGYEKILGRWWVGKADDESHQKAYRHAAKWCRRKLDRAPASILDYACGAGQLLKRLRKAFPNAKLIGYDGAGKLLKKAKKRLGAVPELELVTKILPDLADAHPPVDLTVLCLPHILPFDEGGAVLAYADRHRAELEASRRIVEAMREGDHLEVDEPVEWQVGNAIFERMVARHLRKLTAPDGHCLRIDYTEAPWGEIDEIYRDYLRFTQGECASVCAVKVPRWFRQTADTYRQSDIIGDVGDQTVDYDDEGGYMIRLFEAR